MRRNAADIFPSPSSARLPHFHDHRRRSGRIVLLVPSLEAARTEPNSALLGKKIQPPLALEAQQQPSLKVNQPGPAMLEPSLTPSSLLAYPEPAGSRLLQNLASPAHIALGLGHHP